MQKTPKVTLNIFRGYLQEKGLREAELLTSKVKLANACIYVKLNHRRPKNVWKFRALAATYQRVDTIKRDR